MTNYIPADKLIAEIRRIVEEETPISKGSYYYHGVADTADKLLSFIDSLQQEPRFPQYDNIVDKVFGAGNLEGFEYREAEMLVALAKEELLKSLQQEQTVTKEPISHLEHWLAFFGCPEENIEKCATQIAQGYGAIRYLEGVQHGAEAVNELAKQEQPEINIEQEVDLWRDKNIDKTLDARCSGENITRKNQIDLARHFYGLRNRALEEAARHVYESWMGGTMDDVRRDMVELGKVLNARKEESE